MKSHTNEIDIAVSTRIRLARNISGIPYPRKMTKTQAQELIDTVWSAFDNSPLKNELRKIEIGAISDLEKKALIEKHLISSELCASKVPSVAIISNDEKISLMVNEEDHLRIQVFADGLDSDSAYDTAKKIETLLSEKLTFDCDKEFGYLTSCPTNAGTGLRASVMLHLPAISTLGQVNPLLKWAANLGMTVRGLYGEGSRASGALFQLSNQITMGTSEEDILSRFNAAACSLISEERRLSAQLFEKNEYEMKDKCLRSLGILKNAYMISSSEAMNLVSNVCMGANAGIIKDIDLANLRRGMFSSMPATLSMTMEKASPQDRDVKRAQILQGALQ
ncbi:MAG: ATP--guanido phosphotransferase [Ruminococcaceae bacterium]|nr:ATP--guanido phosphotransferase [Oscillospiraceae bacterium]